MKNLVFTILTFLFFLPINSNATDLLFGNILRPFSFEDAGQEIDIKFEVINNNILPAFSYSISFEIFNEFNQLVYLSEMTVNTPLQPFTTITLTMPDTWVTVPGNYNMEGVIVFFDDINPFNNVTNFGFSVASVSCVAGLNWHKFKSLEVVEELQTFPFTPDNPEEARPGDVIAISCLVEDEDVIQGSCFCEENENRKNYGPYKDKVVYEWSTEAVPNWKKLKGELIKADVPDGNSAMYQLPLKLGKGSHRIRILVEAKNKGQKADDDPIIGYVDISVRVVGNHLPWIVTIFEGTWNYHDDQNPEELMIEGCIPENFEIKDTSDPSTTSSVSFKVVENFCPDYVTILSVEAQDFLLAGLKCVPDSDTYCTEGVEDSTDFAFQDKLDYEWKLLSGKGAFPLGYKGRAVVFHKSVSEDAQIRVTITDLEGSSPPLILQLLVSKAEKPRAFVGVGNNAYVVKEKLFKGNFGYWPGITIAAEYMKEAYEKAGYEVEYTRITNLALVQTVLALPCYQAVSLSGHGVGGIMPFTSGESVWFTPNLIINESLKNWGSVKHPFLRDIILLGCESSLMEGDFLKAMVDGQFFGFEEEVSLWALPLIGRSFANCKIEVRPPYNRALK